MSQPQFSCNACSTWENASLEDKVRNWQKHVVDIAGCGHVETLRDARNAATGKLDRANASAALFCALSTGNAQVVRALREYFELNRTNMPVDNSHIKMAAEKGCEVLRELREGFGAQVVGIDCEALWRAAQRGDVDVLRELRVGYGLSPGHARARDNYALKLAADNNSVDILRELRDGFGLTADDARADNNHALALAAEKGHVNVVRELRITFGLNAEDARARDNHALRYAAAGGHLGVLQELREGFGLTVEDARTRANYALRFAAKSGHVGALRALRVSYGLGTDDARALQNRAARFAMQNNDLETLRELREGYGLNSAEYEVYFLQLNHTEAAARIIIAGEQAKDFSAIEDLFENLHKVEQEDAFPEVPDTCAICLRALLLRDFPGSETMHRLEDVSVTQCGHVFHLSCISDVASAAAFSQGVAKCPLCRAVLESGVGFGKELESKKYKVSNVIKQIAAIVAPMRAITQCSLEYYKFV